MGTTVVTGGGILGLVTAWRLAQAGHTLTVIERDALASAATYASFGWLTSSSAIEPSVTYPLPYRELKVAGIAEYQRVARELGDASWLHVSGHVEWDMAEGGPDRIQRKMVDLHSWGYSAELLPVGDLASLEPDLTPPVGLEAFIYYPNEGYIDPAAFVGLLANQARELGTTIRTGMAVTGLLQERGRFTGVVLASGERIEADTVVACAGIGAPGILEQVGMHLPMLHSVRWAWWR